MHNYIEYFAELAESLPARVVFGLMAIFGLMQAIGEFLEFKGKIVPEYLKVRKYFARRREERDTLRKMTSLLPYFEKVPEALDKTTALLESVDKHYSHDNISMRDKWMQGVNSNIDEIHKWMKEMKAKLDKNSEDTLAIRIDNMRTVIIDFASLVSDNNHPVTKEQFKRIFKLHKEYEGIITANGLTNGEVDIAIRIIGEAYESHLRTHTFVEDSWDI